MKFLSLKGLQKLAQFQTSLPLIVGTTVLSSLVMQPAQAFNVTFSFDPAADDDPSSTVVNDWDHGNGVSSPTGGGWVSGQNTGTATDSATGTSITFTGASPSSNSSSDPNLAGTAESRPANFTVDNENLDTAGLIIANVNNSDDNNGITSTVSGSTETLSGGTLENYQLLTFEFSTPVIIDSSTRFFIDDIDDIDPNGNPGYIDAIAVEGFTTSEVGTPGTGIDPTFSFESSTELAESTIDFDNDPNNGNEINYVYDSVDSGTTNPVNASQSRAYYDFGSQEVQSIALYYFNGIDTSDTNGHGIAVGGTFEVEPVPFEFSPGLGLLLSGAGLLGIKHLKRRRKNHSIDISHK